MLSGSTACADHGMTFLHGHELTSRMQSLVREPGPLKVAIPDGGPHALRRLGLDPTRPGTRMVCCLNGSVSASEVIGHLGEGARQNDRLRAKVIWTPSAAIVGSADALSNGIPDDEKTAAGLIEAGVLVLLRHNVSGMRITAVQHGHRSSFRTRSTIRVRRMVEIEFAT